MATDWEQVARNAAISAGIDPEIFARQIRAESGFNPNAGSPAGAVGIAQIMPATARGWGVDPTDPNASLTAAAKAMRKYLKSYDGDWRKALAAYNAGVGAVAKYGGVPPYKETQNYIARILNGKNPTGTVRPATTNPSPASTSAVVGSAATDPRTQALEFIFRGSPFAGMASARYTAGAASAAPAASPNVQTGKGVPKRKPGEKGYQYLQRIGQKFGLRNDAGDSQTTGGRHTAGSRHYAGQAVDYGDGANSREQLQAYHDYLDANREAIGISELIWQAPGHYDHVHAATSRRAQKGVSRG